MTFLSIITKAMFTSHEESTALHSKLFAWIGVGVITSLACQTAAKHHRTQSELGLWYERKEASSSLHTVFLSQGRIFALLQGWACRIQAMFQNEKRHVPLLWQFYLLEKLENSENPSHRYVPDLHSPSPTLWSFPPQLQHTYGTLSEIPCRLWDFGPQILSRSMCKYSNEKMKVLIACSSLKSPWEYKPVSRLCCFKGKCTSLDLIQ